MKEQIHPVFKPLDSTPLSSYHSYPASIFQETNEICLKVCDMITLMMTKTLEAFTQKLQTLHT